MNLFRTQNNKIGFVHSFTKGVVFAYIKTVFFMFRDV